MIISQVLANLFLHYAFDAWMAHEHLGRLLKWSKTPGPTVSRRRRSATIINTLLVISIEASLMKKVTSPIPSSIRPACPNAALLPTQLWKAGSSNSCAVAHSEILSSVEHRQSKYLNNRCTRHRGPACRLRNGGSAGFEDFPRNQRDQRQSRLVIRPSTTVAVERPDLEWSWQ